ncbi:MerC domain-containing protein [Pontibacter sp. G13]|uniref:MerC domain-containing protein n=1 Tax=Pontibacter sp. G13 TaxID=3074898 RepID=UPI00288A038A|nr:MerC domain-containing protein [Pontibacter sp. G13]WNJ19225.1 MerC domain-containing protein [Pontibacter sp. G13]
MDPSQPTSQRSYSDYLGIASALLCLVHCLAGPIFLGFSMHTHSHGTEAHAHTEDLGTWAWVFDPNWDFLFLAIGFVAVWFSSKHTHQNWMKGVMWGTFACLSMAILLERFEVFFEYLVYAGSAALILVHLLNIKHMLRPSAPSKTPELAPSRVQ